MPSLDEDDDHELLTLNQFWLDLFADNSPILEDLGEELDQTFKSSLQKLRDSVTVYKSLPEILAITPDEVQRLKQSKELTTMDKQARAVNALEPFLALNQAAESPKAVAEAITQATSAPNTYVFTELLCTPKILELEKSEEEGYLELLKIYDHGVWADYVAQQSTLPQLSPAQTRKLKLLSLITLASSHSTLTYPSLQSALALPTQRDLEALITEAIYAGLITGKMDPLHQRVDITSPSDLRGFRPGAVNNMKAELAALEARCQDSIQHLMELEKKIKRDARERFEREAANQNQIRLAMEREDAKAGVGNKRGAGGEDGGAEEAEMMDLDEENAGKKGMRSSKKGALGFGGRRLGGA